MKKFEIEAENYSQYRFKTYAQNAESAEQKIRNFLGKPDAKCRATESRNHTREIESCRVQVETRCL